MRYYARYECVSIMNFYKIRNARKEERLNGIVRCHDTKLPATMYRAIIPSLILQRKMG